MRKKYGRGTIYSSSLSLSLILSLFSSLSFSLSLSASPLRPPPARTHVEQALLHVCVCMRAPQKYRRQQVRACARVVDQRAKNIGESFFPPRTRGRTPTSVDDRVYFRARYPLPSTSPIRPFRWRWRSSVGRKYVRARRRVAWKKIVQSILTMHHQSGSF